MRKRSTRFPIHFVLVAILTFFVIAGFYTFFTYRSMTAPVANSDNSFTTFEVASGETTTDIANNLYEIGLIRSPFGFRLVVRKEGLSGKLQAGIYRLSRSMKASEIARSMSTGFNDVRLTIPEGFRVEEIAVEVERVLGIPQEDFLLQAQDHEGSLFPDTYFFAADTTADQVVTKMLDNFEAKTSELDLTGDDLILASLIERETRGDEEKPIVAGILLKRLEAGWPLQLDATVQYIVGDTSEWWPNTTVADRERSSTYNTYLHPGLPPRPIANPGLTSIQAALNPQSSAYWYYLHDKDGLIRYAETDAEHAANIARYIY